MFFVVVDGAINNKYVKELQNIQKNAKRKKQNRYYKTISFSYYLEHLIQQPIPDHRIWILNFHEIYLLMLFSLNNISDIV